MIISSVSVVGVVNSDSTLSLSNKGNGDLSRGNTVSLVGGVKILLVGGVRSLVGGVIIQ